MSVPPCLYFSITSITEPVFGSIRLTGEAAPSDPYNSRSRLRLISSTGAMELRRLARLRPPRLLYNFVGDAMSF